MATAFRELPRAASFGTPTAGYTSANSVHKLADGALLALTQAVYVDRAGTSLDELPIQPDHTTAADAASDTALEWLRFQACSA